MTDPAPLSLTELRRFPVKSCRGESLESAVVEPWGLAGDRRWMLVDETGEAVTVREQRRMLLIHPRLRADGGLGSARPTSESPTWWCPPRRGRPAVDVTLFGGAPFEAVAGRRRGARVVQQGAGRAGPAGLRRRPARRRPARRTPARGRRWPSPTATRCCSRPRSRWPRSTTLIAAGQKADEGPLPMVRFRPNLVVGGGLPWSEDGWRRFRIGEATFLVVKGCARCAIPTTDEVTAVATRSRRTPWPGTGAGTARSGSP